MGIIETFHEGSVEQSKKHQLVFCVSVQFWPHLDIPICFFGRGLGQGRTPTLLEISVCEQSGTLLKGQAILDSKSSLRRTKACYKEKCMWTNESSNPKYTHKFIPSQDLSFLCCCPHLFTIQSSKLLLQKIIIPQLIKIFKLVW